MAGDDKVRRTGGERRLRDNLATNDKLSGNRVIRDDSSSCDRDERRRGRFVEQNAREGNQDEWARDYEPRGRSDCTTSSRSSRRTTSTSGTARQSGSARRTKVEDISDFE